ncbi:MAG: hypothetical protein JWN76_3736 [Chitinophagaceae bacterium]|nr:hypothetical protein [Chitinophagaceae bacterium]
MKKELSILTLLLFLFVLPAFTQNSIHVKSRIYKVLTTGSNSAGGYLASLNDSGVIVSPMQVAFNPYRQPSPGDVFVNAHFIDKVWLRRKGATAKGILAGALIGAGTGVLLGLIDGSDFKKNKDVWCIFCMTTGEKAAVYGGAAGLTGGIIGGVIGAFAHKTFIIGGRKENLDDLKFKVVR